MSDQARRVRPDGRWARIRPVGRPGSPHGDDRPTTRLAAVAGAGPPSPVAAPRVLPALPTRRAVGSLVGLIPLLATLVLLGGAALVLTGGVPRPFGAPPITAVPRLVDHDLPEATSIAGAHGLGVAVVDTIATDDRPRGSVVAQDPHPDSRVGKGSEVKVTLSAGIRPPDVIGRSLDEARAILVRGGWSIGGVEGTAGGAATAGTVVAMRPGPGEPALSRQQPIGLVVSGAPAGGAPAAPTVGTLSDGWGAGARAAVAAGSTDRAGRLGVVAGSTGVSANPTLRLTFSGAFGAPPASILVLPVGTNDGPLMAAGMARLLATLDRQPGYVEFQFLHTPVAGATYTFDYMIAGP